ncbi:MAG: sugar ABC transporter permease [Clostridiales bacterium]|nr:sugar ABC transporter permease [Clostridiales bacterium]
MRIHWQLYVLLALPVVFLLLFHYVPMAGVQLAFRKFAIRKGVWGSPWIGFDNFTRFFTSYMFGRVIRNTATLSAYGLLAGFPLPIVFALCLNLIRHPRYKSVVQIVTYAPHFISTTVMVGMLLALLNKRTGIYGNVWLLLTGQYPPDLFGSASAFPHLYVWSGIWQSLGWSAIIYVAALAGVDMELHEAAQIDGANRFQRLVHIDLVAVLPTASIMLILSSGNILSVGFEKVYLMQNNLNLQNSEIISTYVYKVGLTGTTDFSYSTAIGLFNSVVNMAMLVLVNFITRRLSNTSLF